MYHFTKKQMRVVRSISLKPENKALLEKARFIVLEHILPTTEEFLGFIDEAGGEIYTLIAKPYSKNLDVLKRLKEAYHILEPNSYSELEDSKDLNRILIEANKKSEEDGKQIIIIDVGGYFAEPLLQLDENDRKFISGVVEDTTFGHNRYKQVIGDIFCPVLSVARSELKEIEARFVGRDAVQAMDKLLREIGITITGRNALVIGYGMIGKNVARTLRSYDLNVYVYDIEDRQLIRAYIDGFHIHKKNVLLRHADIIFFATGSESLFGKGHPAMNSDELEDCKNGVVLASVGSKDTEFDVDSIKRAALETTVLSNHLVKYSSSLSKNIVVAKDGTAVNFILPSIPTEILDIVFSEILNGVLAILKKDEKIDLNVINRSEQTILNYISKSWLRSVNMEVQA